jgi:hypothetical protein
LFLNLLEKVSPGFSMGRVASGWEGRAIKARAGSRAQAYSCSTSSERSQRNEDRASHTDRGAAID